MRPFPVASGCIDDIDDDRRQVGRHEDGGRVPAKDDLNLEAFPRLVGCQKSEKPVFGLLGRNLEKKAKIEERK